MNKDIDKALDEIFAKYIVSNDVHYADSADRQNMVAAIKRFMVEERIDQIMIDGMATKKALEMVMEEHEQRITELAILNQHSLDGQEGSK